MSKIEDVIEEEDEKINKPQNAGFREEHKNTDQGKQNIQFEIFGDISEGKINVPKHNFVNRQRDTLESEESELEIIDYPYGAVNTNNNFNKNVNSAQDLRQTIKYSDVLNRSDNSNGIKNALSMNVAGALKNKMLKTAKMMKKNQSLLKEKQKRSLQTRELIIKNIDKNKKNTQNVALNQTRINNVEKHPQDRVLRKGGISGLQNMALNQTRINNGPQDRVILNKRIVRYKQRETKNSYKNKLNNIDGMISSKAFKFINAAQINKPSNDDYLEEQINSKPGTPLSVNSRGSANNISQQEVINSHGARNAGNNIKNANTNIDTNTNTRKRDQQLILERSEHMPKAKRDCYDLSDLCKRLIFWI